MTDTTAPMTADYGTIIKQLQHDAAAARSAYQETGANTTFIRTHWLRDFCTVQVGGARQTGKTESILSLVDPETVVLVVNKQLAELLAARILQRWTAEGKRPPDMLLKVMSAEDLKKEIGNRLRQTVHLPIDPELQVQDAVALLEKLFLEQKEQHNSRLRIVTPMYKRFIVDDASYFFEKVDMKTFYKWVELHTCEEDPEIILVG